MDVLNKIIRARGKTSKYNLLFISTKVSLFLIILFGEPVTVCRTQVYDLDKLVIYSWLDMSPTMVMTCLPALVSVVRV